MRKLLIATSIIWLALAACGLTYTNELQAPTLRETLHLTATESVKAMVEAVLNIAKNTNLPAQSTSGERRAKIRKALAERFDFDDMARRSLGIYWCELPPEAQKEFVTLFTDMLGRCYAEMLEGFSDEKIVYLGEQVAQEGDAAVVRTKIVTKRNVAIPVDYRLLKRDERWEVYDLLIDQVSMVNNYRVLFGRMIRMKAFAALGCPR